MREEVDLRRRVAECRPGRPLGETGHDLRPGVDSLLIERLEHRAARRAGPRDEEQVGVRVLRLLGERREVGRAQRHRDLGDVVTAEERLHGRVVAVAEHAVLVEDDDLLARRLAEVRLRGEHVLDRLPPGAERVLVDAGDRVGGRRAGDVQHLVLGGERSDLHRDAGRAGAHQDLGALPDQVLRRGDAGGGVALVVDVGDVERLAVDLVRSLGRVLEPELEALDLLGAVGPESAGARVDEADLVRRGRRVLGLRGDGRRAGEQREQRSPEHDLREAMAHERILLV